MGLALRGVDAVDKPGRSSPAEGAAQAKASRNVLTAMMGKTESEVIHEVDTSRCRLWKHHNRMYELLTLEDCQDVVDSMRVEGQIDAAVARKLRDDPDYDYEIIAGARRLWSCTYLKRPIKVTVKDFDDRQAFLFSDASNRYNDISAYERAIEYKHALEAYFDGNQSEFANSVGRSIATISRFKALWELEAEVVAAYPDPRKITPKIAAELRASMSTDKAKAALLKVAAALAEVRMQPDAEKDPAAITKQLVLATREKAAPKAKKIERVFDSANGKRMLVASGTHGGAFSLQIPKGHSATRDELEKAFKQVLDDVFHGEKH